MDRREFVKTSGAVTASMLPIGRIAAARDRIDRIGLQLYTVRSLMQTSVERTLSSVAAIGFKEVEFAGYFERPPRAIKELLDDNGMASPSAHIGLDVLRGPWNRTLSDAAEIGHKWLVIASIADSDGNSVDAIKRTADLIHKAADDAKFYKIRLAYHNHDVEFANVGGRPMFDQLLELTKPDELQIEMDLYWITKAGADPLAYFTKWPGRTPMVHVKDAGPAPQYRMEDVGRGTIDWAKIFSHHKEAGIKHYFVEHDDATDPLASAKASYEYLRKLDF
ncbi:MAG TPA: sugar phosphate isomerase/epimerase [Gemmatimonadales bacterium]|jgi:sugar phosphate isomerase/epimerase